MIYFCPNGINFSAQNLFLFLGRRLEDSIIEKISEYESEEINDIGTIHYLPHRLVINEGRETTKVRVAFDASSKITGPKLNGCLFSGLSITEVLFSIFLLSRVDRIAMIADIEKAFLQIAVSEKRKLYSIFVVK